MTPPETNVPWCLVICESQHGLLVACKPSTDCGTTRPLLDGLYSRHDRLVVDMVSRHFSEKACDQRKMNRDFASLLIVGNRVGLHAHEVSKASDSEARLAQLAKKIVIGHSPIRSSFNEN